MFKSIVAVIVSYIAMFVVFMAIFFGLYFALGVERVFQPDSYEVSMLWIIITLVVAFLVTMFAGYRRLAAFAPRNFARRTRRCHAVSFARR